MKLSLFAILCCLVSCSESIPSKSSSVPDNVISDSPIVLNEGQSITFRMENSDLMVAAAVTNGELAVWKLSPIGRVFEVVWKDAETWKTSTEFNEGEKRVTIIDQNGDGVADFMRKGTPSNERRGQTSDMVKFVSKGQEWEEVVPKR